MYWLIVSTSHLLCFPFLGCRALLFEFPLDYCFILWYDSVAFVFCPRHSQPHVQSLMSHLQGERQAFIIDSNPYFILSSLIILYSTLLNVALVLLLDTWHETFCALFSGGHFPSSLHFLNVYEERRSFVSPTNLLFFSSFSHMRMQHLENPIPPILISPVPDRIRRHRFFLSRQPYRRSLDCNWILISSSVAPHDKSQKPSPNPPLKARTPLLSGPLSVELTELLLLDPDSPGGCKGI